MSWTMPHRVLQIVASLIVLAAVSSFTMGILNAPQRGRLPGERIAAGSKPGAPAADVTEATPLSQERIEGPPPPPPEAKKTDEAADNEPAPEDQVEEPDAGNAPIGQAGNAVALAPPPVGNSLGNSAMPPPEEPPH